MLVVASVTSAYCWPEILMQETIRVCLQVEPCFVRSGLLDTSEYQAAALKVSETLPRNC